MGGQFSSFLEDLAECEDVAQVLAVVARQAATLVGEASVLTIVSEDGSTLQPTEFHHHDPEVVALMRDVLLGVRYAVGDGLAGSVATQGVPVALAHGHPADLEDQIAPGARPFAARYPIRAVMIVPMIAYGEIVGTLGVMRLESHEPYSNEALLALEALADRAARSIAEAQRAPRRLTAADHEAIFRYSVDGVLFTVPDGRILAANPAACRILRRSERDICLAGRRGVVVDDDGSRTAVATRAEAGYMRSEFTMRRGDGTEFIADVSSTIFTNDSGEIRACVTFRDITDQVRLRAELEEKTRALEQLAREDSLTKLRNRRAFVEDAMQALAIADRDKATVQLVFIDLDDLKGINDRYGHDIGDEVLQRLSAAIDAETRASDVTARFGGDEFVALLYGSNPSDARLTLQRIVAACNDSAGPPVSLSYGLVERAVGSSPSLEHLLHEADQRMYEQKARPLHAR